MERRIRLGLVIDILLISPVTVALIERRLQIERNIGIRFTKRNSNNRQTLAKRGSVNFGGRGGPAAANANPIWSPGEMGDATSRHSNSPPTGLGHTGLHQTHATCT